MDMNKTFLLKVEDQEPRWRLIDASGKVVGRLATEIADALRGKDKPTYTPHSDAGDYVVVINAEKAVLTGDKMEGKIYDWYTNYIGGYKTASAKAMAAKNPTFILEHAVKGMIGKSKLSNAQFKKLRIYAGAEHPHIGQMSGKLAAK